MNDKSVFEAALAAWRAGRSRLDVRLRMKDYTYGRQWGDPVLRPDGAVTTEYELAVSNGAVPLTNNLIRQIVKGVVGRFRHAWDSTAPDEIKRRNHLDEIDARTLEEFLISGMAIQRVVNERRSGGVGPWVDMVSPSRFFVGDFRDPRGSDIELVGMLHDMSLAEVVMRFGGDAGANRRIEALYSGGDSAAPFADADDFFVPSAPSRCRVIEVWTMEAASVLKCHDRERGEAFIVDIAAADAVAAENKRRSAAGLAEVESAAAVSLRWRCRFFAPCASLLATFISPWAHGSHPFAIKFYPMIDGEVHPFVEDLIDQQRHINRLITQMDHVLGASAKGNLLFPVGAKPENLTWKQIREHWGRPGAVIPYIDTPSGQVPEPVSTTAANNQAAQLLDIELDLIQRVSGVSGALLGQNPTTANASSTIYAAQSDNGVIALLDIFETFAAFTAERDRLLSLTRPT